MIIPETWASLIMIVAFGPWPCPREIGWILSDISLSAAKEHGPSESEPLHYSHQPKVSRPNSVSNVNWTPILENCVVRCGCRMYKTWGWPWLLHTHRFKRKIYTWDWMVLNNHCPILLKASAFFFNMLTDRGKRAERVTQHYGRRWT